ncbi:MFS transporter [Methylobacterium sp. J-072]|uniref:MFS transporter n=1 Tax=Methylobacterium sp. J-072 TaxID=2836651 RepID=UPI001FBBA160|nr:MFS transporter [Methylobacterium sp. J-072]MCJ2092385.1 MFS transporter [Methylobacterium sp. J-072]
MGSLSDFYGWRVVAAAFIVAVFGWGVGFYGPPVYLEVVRQAHGWPITLVSGAVTLHFLAGVGIVANLPALHRRFGLPAVTFAGAVVLALGVLGWACAQTPGQLYAAALLTGAGWPALGAAAVNAMIAPWFVARRPAALSMAYNGASIGGVLFSPLWVALIGRVGFPAAALIVGAVMVGTLGLLALIVLPRTPGGMGQIPDGNAGAAANPKMESAPMRPVARLAHDRAFLTLSLGMALALFAQIGLIAQFVSVLAPALGTQGAGLAAGLSTAAAIAGRMLVGWCMPAGADRRAVAALNLLVQALGCGVLILSGSTDVALLLLGIVLVGSSIGNATSLPPLIAQVEFAQADAPRVVALIVALSQAAYAFAPALFGLLRQLGSDNAIFWAAAAIQLAASGAYLAGCRACKLRPGAIGPLPRA